jgi:Putative adhesin
MPTFDTPEPIAVTIALVVGDVRITASDRTDTVVVVSPSDSSKESDVKAAERTRVEYSHGRLLIKTPRTWKQYTPFGGGESIDVAIELPAGSHAEGEASVADFRCDGRFGECRFTTAAGNIRLDHTGPLHLSTGAGSVTVDRAVGRAEVTGSGQVRIREIDGPAVIKNLNGVTWVGEVTGDLRCNAANGDITVDRALAGVGAKTANGAVRIGEVVRGSVVLSTANGELEVGIREGTAALLDVRSQFGRVRNSLAASDGPEPSDQTVEVRARTSYGDIVIRRSRPSPLTAEMAPPPTRPSRTPDDRLQNARTETYGREGQ